MVDVVVMRVSFMCMLSFKSTRRVTLFFRILVTTAVM